MKSLKCVLLITCILLVIKTEFAGSSILLPYKQHIDNLSVRDRCLQMPDRGVCREEFTNYYYNLTSGECESFVYGGCGGNDNNFQSLHDCETECEFEELSEDAEDSFPLIMEDMEPHFEHPPDDFEFLSDYFENPPDDCEYPPEKGECKECKIRYYFNGEKCEAFIYGGCGGNLNNFLSEEECTARCMPLIESRDVCEYPPENGICRKLIERYYFNGEKCETFIYGGCGGNPNNFISEEECTARCKPVAESKNDCEYPPERGPCRARKLRYYFDGEKCESFMYGGCLGNPNNFLTEEECTEKCMPLEIKEVCEYPPEKGICRARKLRYYFDGQKCETFFYGGCGGNPNNFLSEEECTARCKPVAESMDVCEYPPEKGICRARKLRYYFDGEKCDSFIYGGCLGNSNNFVTEEECTARCMAKLENENNKSKVQEN